ncbi:MAG: hypothetical protein IKY66_01700 [Bacteroidales bacterium]|nr:hypothetical protein [Bacteroidales bacterium]
MKSQQEFIDAVMSGKTLVCGTNKIRFDEKKITVLGDGFSSVGEALKASNVEEFVHLVDSLGRSKMALFVPEWVIA